MASHIDPEGWKRKVRRRWITVGIAAGVLALAALIWFLLSAWLLPSLAYGRAEDALEAGDLQGAIDGFVLLGDYRDASSRAAELALSRQTDPELVQALKRAQPGEVVEFGRYEQDNDPGNGPEPIVWIVLARENGKVLLWSGYVLDAVPFHSQPAKITWADCSLRQWLNRDFFEAAFTPEERCLCAVSRLDNQQNGNSGANGGKDTEDRLFVPSSQELYDYGDAAGQLYAWPTAYAAAQGVTTHDQYGTCSWWLRTPGSHQDNVAICDMVGSLMHTGGVNRIGIGVRPMVWVLAEP